MQISGCLHADMDSRSETKAFMQQLLAAQGVVG
jgi:hypothetical protein